MTFAELLDSVAENIRTGFTSSIDDIIGGLSLKQLIEAIETGDFDTVWQLFYVAPGIFRPLTRALEQSFEEGARWVAEDYPKNLAFRFDVSNPRAQDWLRNQSSTLVRNVSDDTRAGIRQALDSGMRRGVNPRTTALDIVGRYDPVTKRRVGGVIGLTPEQQMWVDRTRRQLETLDPAYFGKKLRDKRFDSIVDKAITDGKPLSKVDIERLVTRYADITLKYRGDTIARTEGISALSAADYESTKQIVESGAAREKDVTREWDATNDNRTRDTHDKMEGQRVGLNEPFVSPSGARLLHPHDRSLGAPASEIVGCRCRTKTVIDWIGAAIND